REGTISAAGDLWALGMALVEALTQRTWAGSRGQFETTTSLLASLPAPFSETARRCLSRAPADRPSAAELEAQFRRASPDDVIPDATLPPPQQPSAPPPHTAAAAPQPTPEPYEVVAEPISLEPQELAEQNAPSIIDTEPQNTAEAPSDPNATQNLSL